MESREGYWSGLWKVGFVPVMSHFHNPWHLRHCQSRKGRWSLAGSPALFPAGVATVAYLCMRTQPACASYVVYHGAFLIASNVLSVQ